MNALRNLVKERLSGKSGGSGYSKQVDLVVNSYSNFLWHLLEIRRIKHLTACAELTLDCPPAERRWRQ